LLILRKNLLIEKNIYLRLSINLYKKEIVMSKHENDKNNIIGIKDLI